MAYDLQVSRANIVKTTLSNGLTIIVYPLTTIPKVSVQLWYGVGSKHERDGFRGLAHLLEHMTFKGTHTLSESDINMITHRLSGYCNAFTSHDYTCYVFDMPRHHWTIALQMLSDCMSNCTFKEDLLHSEVGAVIQELKMYQDDYVVTVIEQLIGSIFAYHPYHYPIIGYKHDLWAITRDSLLSFYKEHYIPNNASLVIVGDVDPHEAIAQASNYFNATPAHSDYKRLATSFSRTLETKELTLSRDVQQSQLIFSFVVPGLQERKDYVIDLASWIFADGRGSRLYKKLIEKLHVASDVSVTLYDLFDASVLCVRVSPLKAKYNEAIKAAIIEELENLISSPVSAQELERARAQASMEHLSVFDSTSKISYAIGRSFLATGDEQAIFNYISSPDPAELIVQLNHFFARYLTPTAMHQGTLLPLRSEDRKLWLALQTTSDARDLQEMTLRKRESNVEQGSYAHQIVAQKPVPFSFPRAQKTILPNGLTVLWYNNERSPKVEIVLDLKAKYYYEPLIHEGISSFVSEMLAEGTKRWSAEQFVDELESRGMSLAIQPASFTMSLQSEYLPFACDVLKELLCDATLPVESVEKIREQLFADYDAFWDNPLEFVAQLAKQVVYGDHPYSRSVLGNKDSLARITREDLVAFYKKYYTPQEAILIVVGDISQYNVADLVAQKLGSWGGEHVPDPAFPSLTPITAREVQYPIARDQTVLCFAGLSVDRKSSDFDALLLFEQIFTGGILGSMTSRLYQLREQTGLFYTIGGSLVANAQEQPGIVFIRTIVSPEKADQAEVLIKKEIAQATANITEDDVVYARNAIVTTLVDNFESSAAMAEIFLFLERFQFSSDFLDARFEHLSKITSAEIKKAVERILDLNHIAIIRVGRVKN